MDKKDLAFGRMNFILLGAGMLIVIIGFLLMSGSGSTNEAFNPDIFSVRRTKVAPIVSLIGFLTIIYAVIHNPSGSCKAGSSDILGRIVSTGVILIVAGALMLVSMHLGTFGTAFAILLIIAGIGSIASLPVVRKRTKLTTQQ